MSHSIEPPFDDPAIEAVRHRHARPRVRALTRTQFLEQITMAPGDATQGRRLPDGAKWYGDSPDAARAGDYGRVLIDGEWVWRCRTPSGLGGNLELHEVTEHEDGTITVSPSILVEAPGRTEGPTGWHGFLERGVWREV